MKDKQTRDKKAIKENSESKVRRAMPKLKQLKNTDAQKKVGGKAQSGLSCMVATCF